LYVVPVETQANCFWDEISRALAPAIGEGIFKKNESERFIEKPGTDQRISCKTAWDPDSLRSDYADFVCLDEWQLQSERVWSEVLAPSLLDHDGVSLFIFTPPSFHARDVSRAKDPRHAAKLFRFAEQDRTGRWATFSWPSHDNPHISRTALAEVCGDMTALSFRQEILAEIIEENPTALWSRAVIERNRVPRAPDLTRIIVALDPSVTSKETSDEAGIIVGGIGADNHGYVLADLSRRDTPSGWASAAISAYHTHKADNLVYEQNQGGDLVRLTIATVDPNVPCKSVVASRGKATRAEPVASLYEQNRVHHVGVFERLEDELCGWTPGDPSPNRLDSLTWCLSELMLHTQAFGLLDYFESGQAQAELVRLETSAPQPVTSISKPAPTEAHDGCPECESRCLIPIPGNAQHCNSCGWQGPIPGLKRPKTVYAGFGRNGQPAILWR
jgi:hypothetical protein